MRLSRRGLQLALGVLWLLDGALQLQPVMFTRQFARGIIEPAGSGQPALVHWLVTSAAAVIGARPVLFDALFASVQLLLGIGLLWRRTSQGALVASISWALGVWIFGEGLGGVLGSGATLLNGAPGAAILYALLGLAALDVDWRGRHLAVASRFLAIAWAVIWTALAALALALGANAGGEIAASFRANASALPGLLEVHANALAALLQHDGALPGIALGLACALIGLAGLWTHRWRVVAGVAGGSFALFTWVFAEALGGIGTGKATDPNSGPLLVLFAVALSSQSLGARRQLVATPLADAPVHEMSGSRSHAA